MSLCCWADLTTRDAAALAGDDRAIALLPVAAIEQHGPHLPVGVDMFILDGVIARAMALAPADPPVFVLPTQAIGKSNEHLAFPGTLTLGAETLGRLWTEILEGAIRAGLRRLVILNSHGGQPQVMEIVARDLRVRHGVLAVAANWYGFGVPDGLFPAAEIRHGIHGGAIETAMMMHLRPDLVRRDKLKNFRSYGETMAAEFKLLGPIGPVAKFGWQTQDLNPEGACGDATDADPERGAKLVDHAARGLLDLLSETARFPLSALARS